MTSQIEQLIEDIRFNFNEDDSVILKTYIERLEQQNTAWADMVEMQSQKISQLQARIKELEEPKTCATCKYWYEKSCSNNDGIAYNGTNAVYEYDYCKDYEQKQN